ncbi:MAG: 3-dehydroquinate synthase [Pseudomonadaceae bacterium]|nr:3-dehydroquinate synthase [Pseudomonadaceae bacterium]
MRQVRVELGERSYPIHIGSGLLSDAALLRASVSGSQALVLTNPTVADLYLERVLSAFTDVDVDVHMMPDGESHKSLEEYGRALDFLLSKRHNRTTTVVALGGGVVGDLAGFVAATYQRGVGFVQIPTTLLAQVDSSVGGKTAVNHSAGKNMIGAFYQPSCVIADLAVLASLPAREFRAGLAEVIKYGVIFDAGFFAWLEESADKILALDEAALAHAVARSAEIKAEVVASDERESGIRAILNYGHTFGHAIEKLTQYGTYLHGEAVAIGMVQAAIYGCLAETLSIDDGRRIRRLVERFELPCEPPQLSVESVLEAMGMDKKVSDGKLRLIVPVAIGRVEIRDADSKPLRQALEYSVAGASPLDGSSDG